MSRRFVAVVSAMLAAFGLSAQEMVWHVEDVGFFDNREAHSGYCRSQTYFGSRLGAEGGLADGSHMLLAGGYAVKEFGARGLCAYDLTMYYRYEGTRFSGAFGAFPRRLLQRELSTLFVDDSIYYYRPNMTGALLQYAGIYGETELYCNWRSRQTTAEREIFDIVSDGAWRVPLQRGAFLAGYEAQLTHFSVRRGKTPDKVYDKVMLHPWTGWKTTECGMLADSLTVTAGAVISFNRDRTDKLWKTPAGFYSDIQVDKGRFVLRNRLYYGAAQLSDYELYGRALHQGDTYFCSPLYDRVDVSFVLLRSARAECMATTSFHVTEGAVDNSQMVRLHVLF